MSVALPSRLAPAAFAATATAILALLGGPAAPARADHCQPEEIVYRTATGDTTWQSPSADDDDPRCYVAEGLGCPNQAAQPDCAVAIARFAASGEPYPGCYDSPPIVTARWFVENTLCAATGGDPGSSGG
jgi:hypothetical protein